MPEFQRSVESHNTWRRFGWCINEKLPEEALASNTRSLPSVRSFLPVVSIALLCGGRGRCGGVSNEVQERNLPSKQNCEGRRVEGWRAWILSFSLVDKRRT